MSRMTYFPTVPVDQIPHSHYGSTARPNGSPVAPEKHRPVVLVVDDERIIADTMSLIFSHNGFAVLTAYDGASGLELAALIPPELLITDVVMPGMTGIELAIAIKQTVPDCEILIFSGQASTTDMLAVARLAGHDFAALSKPVHPTVMLAEASRRLNLPTQNRKRPIPISGPPILDSLVCVPG
jgi:DNA-binding response OmpR family regulator